MNDRLQGIRNPDGWWINTEVFREEALHFMKYGYYTSAPVLSPDWVAYWREQLDRCLNGYSVGGCRITGDHYFYLNFCRIKLTDVVRTARSAEKSVTFPHFWDYDYNYYHSVEIARHGISKEELAKLHLEVQPLFIDGGRHLMVGKARRKGYSYKNGSICANRYNTVRDSITIIGAFDKKYLYPDGTMSMATNYLSFLNEHTGWAKKREFTDTIFHKKASFKEERNGVPVEKGYRSQIMALTFKDNPHAARGKDGTLILMEEVGSWPGFKDAYMAIRPSLEDGKYVTGMIIAYGTSGDMEGGTRDFAEMFYTPDAYGLLPFLNIWDEEAGEGARCSLFVPDYVTKPGFIDSNGNSLKKEAIDHNQGERDKIIKTASGSSALDGYIQEYPFSPAEAFLRSSKNIFPVEELRRQLNRVRANELFLKKGQPVELIKEGGVVKAVPDLTGKLRPITDYPVKQKDITGAVIIYEWPAESTVSGLYKIGFDPYRQHLAQTDSLAAAFVYKSANDFSYSGDTIVAEYVGRPETYEDCYRTIEYLAEYYNAEIMFENEVTSVADYFKSRKKLQLLAPQPNDVIAAHISNSKVNRNYGIHMTAKLKDAAEKYLQAWLLYERSVDMDGKAILNLETIYSIPLLEELIKYDPTNGNFDRISALFTLMFAIKQDELGKVYSRENPQKAAMDELQQLMRTKYSKNVIESFIPASNTAPERIG